MAETCATFPLEPDRAGPRHLSVGLADAQIVPFQGALARLLVCHCGPEDEGPRREGGEHLVVLDHLHLGEGRGAGDDQLEPTRPHAGPLGNRPHRAPRHREIQQDAVARASVRPSAGHRRKEVGPGQTYRPHCRQPAPERHVRVGGVLGEVLQPEQASTLDAMVVAPGDGPQPKAPGQGILVVGARSSAEDGARPGETLGVAMGGIDLAGENGDVGEEPPVAQAHVVDGVGGVVGDNDASPGLQAGQEFRRLRSAERFGDVGE